MYAQSNEAQLLSIQAQPTTLPTVITPTATATPQATWTPSPRPPSATPTVVIPIATLAVSTLAPTPKPIDWTAYYVELFADCNGRYAGEEKEKRRRAVEYVLKQGYRTLPELIAIVKDKCQ